MNPTPDLNGSLDTSEEAYLVEKLAGRLCGLVRCIKSKELQFQSWAYSDSQALFSLMNQECIKVNGHKYDIEVREEAYEEWANRLREQNKK